ncbi:MAG: hypothetical protein ABIH76_08630 [Candidatus Bathyarchaeota archaeon]
MSNKQLLITSSREPTNSVRTLLKDLNRVIPQSSRANRGKLSMNGLANLALILRVKYILVIGRWKGGPGKIEFYMASKRGLNQIPPIIFIGDYHLQREYGITHKKVKRGGILSAFNPELQKISKALSEILNMPIISHNQWEGYQAYMHVSNIKQNLTKLTFFSCKENLEIGPSLILRIIKWEIQEG